MSLGNELRRRKILIKLGSTCNNSCVFCHSGKSRHVGADKLNTQEYMRRINKASETGAEMVVFSGGEPTIRKDIFKLCEYASGLGLEAGIITNGRMLCYKDFASRLVEAGVRYILVSLHGDDAETHNLHTGSDSFIQTVAGIRNAAALETQLVVNTVLTRANADRLSAIARLLSAYTPLRYKISLPEPKGAALDNFQFALAPNDAARAVARFLQSHATTPGVEIGFDGFTPCLLEDYFALNDDFFTHGFFLISYPDDDDFYPPDHGKRSYSDCCAACSVRHICPGVYAEYFKRFPHLDIEPLMRPVSNSIRFDLRYVYPYKGADSMCDAAFGSGPAPARGVALKKGGKLYLYETKESETDAAELMRIKRKLEQVYYYDSEKGGNPDGPERLNKTSLINKCRECARRMLCPGVFELIRKKPYSGAVAETRAALETIRGRALEVGCGKGPFFDYFRQRLREGAVSFYAGIDPELEREEKSKGGKFILKRSRLEDFKWRGEDFDCVILHRSYHHLIDLSRALDALATVTRAGGAVIIIEDYKHIELHGRLDSGDRAGGSLQRFHHYRNHSAADAALQLEKHGFIIEKIRPVTRDTAPVWTVFAVKSG